MVYEAHTKNVRFSIRTDRSLWRPKRIQRIDIFSSEEFGRFLTLDGYMMTHREGRVYLPEMIVQVPMAVHPSPKNVLVTAGRRRGRPGAVPLRSVESIDLVERSWSSRPAAVPAFYGLPSG